MIPGNVAFSCQKCHHCFGGDKSQETPVDSDAVPLIKNSISVSWQDPKNYSDAETRGLVWSAAWLFQCILKMVTVMVCPVTTRIKCCKFQKSLYLRDDIHKKKFILNGHCSFGGGTPLLELTK